MDDQLTRQEVARRTASGSFYKLSAQGVTLLLGFTRTVWLARLLSPQDFGLVALALFFVQIGASLAGFGLNAAFIQKESASKEEISTHFILRIIFSLCALLLMVLLSPLFSFLYPDRPILIPLLLSLSVIEVIKALASTPLTLLMRRMQFRRLAIIDILSSLSMLLAAVYLAANNFGVWSIVLGEQLTGALVAALGVWLVNPPWRPVLSFSRQAARSYLSFGKHIMLSLLLDTFLDKFDDFWTASYLGSAAAGFYSKAYEFARYPRRVIIAPLQTVFYAGFSRLKSDQQGLSTAFFQIFAFIVRIGFLVSLILVIAAPEIILLLLTSRWLPMLVAFQLMVVYTLLDPLFLTVSNLLMAVGQPQLITRIKAVQMVAFVPLVILFAYLGGINGVAVVADLMLVLGTLLILWSARKFVEVPFRRIFAAPTLSLLAGLLTSFLVMQVVPVKSLWAVLLLKGTAAGFSYLLVLLLFEYRFFRQQVSFFTSLFRIPG